MADACILRDSCIKSRLQLRNNRVGVVGPFLRHGRPQAHQHASQLASTCRLGVDRNNVRAAAAVQVETNASTEAPGGPDAGPKPTPQELCSLLARRRLAAWLRVGDEDIELMEETITPDSSALTVVSARARFNPPGGPPQALVSIAVVAPPGALGGSDSSEVALSVHWGCSKQQNGGWKAPPPGWSTLPNHSVDAGWGAWQTPMNAAKLADGSVAYVMALQIGLEESLRRSSAGISFVLHTSTDMWINRGGPGANFFLPLHKSPVITSPTLDTAPPTATPIEPYLNGNTSKPPPPSASTPSPSPSPATSPKQPTPAAATPPGEAAQKPAANAEVEAFLRSFHRKDWPWEELLPGDYTPVARSQPTTAMEPAEWMVDRIRASEGNAERSLMHRYNIADGLVAEALQSPAPGPALVAVATWLRLSAMRLLRWNRNYNIKPREISTAQDKLAQRLAGVADNIRSPEAREIMVMAMGAVGRGGASDVGQRVRDEILSVQSRNNCKGGMMEEWHQKLHNNTSPDDVIICEALLAFIRSKCDISEYWRVLHASNITRERLKSFDRPIVSEPSFSADSLPGLEVDLTSYLQTLRAVHTGSDLRSAAAVVLGYQETSMKGKAVNVPPVEGVATDRLKMLVEAALYLQQQKGDAGLEGAVKLVNIVVEARRELFVCLQNAAPLVKSGRLKDVMFLDLALESVGRMAVEACLSEARALDPSKGLRPLMALLLPACEAAVLSSRGSVELAVCYQHLYQASVQIRDGMPDGLPLALAGVERLKRVIADGAVRVSAMLQPTAEALCWQMGISGPQVDSFSEEVVRCGAAAPLSQLAAIMEPRLREASGASKWQIISRGTCAAAGKLLVLPNLSAASVEGYDPPVVLLLRGAIRGEEEVPAGVSGVVAAEVPDVLSHAAVRARNTSTMLLGCPDTEILEQIQALEGRAVRLDIEHEDVQLTDLGPYEEAAAKLAAGERPVPELTANDKEGLKVPPWCGRYAVRVEEFKQGLVGNKSLFTSRLYGRLGRWVHQPGSVSIPFGVLEAAIEHPDNREARAQLAALTGRAESEQTALSKLELAEARLVISQLQVPPGLRQQLLAAFAKARLPAVDSDSKWEACWGALRGVWASVWNERAEMALRKAKMDRGVLRMAVLCQDVVPFSHSFVAHSFNPVNNNQDEVYVEVVEGLGEVLVGSYPGRGLSAVVKKSAVLAATQLLRDGVTEAVDPSAVTIVGYPSKSTALLVPASATLQGGWRSSAIIFRSDSNAEDLEGFAGAGLFDSHMTVSLRAVVAGSGPSYPLATDPAFQRSLVLRAAAVAVLAEQKMGCPQDVEGGVLDDGAMFIVQARPQV